MANLGDYINQGLNMFPGISQGNLATASVIPALATAAQQYHNAGQYEDIGREAMNVANPVSTDTRQKYQNRLDQFYTDPMAFLKGNPEYMASMGMGLDRLGALKRASGSSNSGEATADELRFLSQLSSQYVNQEREALSNLGGFQFNPASGAEMLVRGSENALNARTSALDAMLAPLGLAAMQNRLNPQGGAPGGSPGYPNGSPYRNQPGQNPNDMNGGLGNARNSLSGLGNWGIQTGFGPGLSEIYGPIGSGNWTGWDDGAGYIDQANLPLIPGYDIPYWDMPQPIFENIPDYQGSFDFNWDDVFNRWGIGD